MRIVQELLKEANISIHELVQSCFYHYFASNSCWLQSWQIFFITFEKRSWKPATTNSSAKKLTKSTLKKKDVEKSTTTGGVVTFSCATIGQLSSLVVELFFMKLL